MLFFVGFLFFALDSRIVVVTTHRVKLLAKKKNTLHTEKTRRDQIISFDVSISRRKDSFFIYIASRSK